MDTFFAQSLCTKPSSQVATLQPSHLPWFGLSVPELPEILIASLTFLCLADSKPHLGWTRRSQVALRPQPPRIGLTMFHESHLGLLPTSLPWQWRCQSLTVSNSIFRDRRLAGVHQSQLWARRCPERNCARVPLLCLALPHQHLHPSSEQGRATMP